MHDKNIQGEIFSATSLRGISIIFVTVRGHQNVVKNLCDNSAQYVSDCYRRSSMTSNSLRLFSSYRKINSQACSEFLHSLKKNFRALWLDRNTRTCLRVDSCDMWKRPLNQQIIQSMPTTYWMFYTIFNTKNLWNSIFKSGASAVIIIQFKFRVKKVKWKD